jgi:hypothetical protein
MGFLERLTNEQLVEKFSNKNLSKNELIQMVNDYIGFALIYLLTKDLK